MFKESTDILLRAVYTELGYSLGDLCDTTTINPSNMSIDNWIAKGAWIKLGHKIHAEKIFFVDNNPVIVFAHSNTEDDETLRNVYNDIWCMARPRILFLAKPGELAVYDLSDDPIKTVEEWRKRSPL